MGKKKAAPAFGDRLPALGGSKASGAQARGSARPQVLDGLLAALGEDLPETDVNGMDDLMLGILGAWSRGGPVTLDDLAKEIAGIVVTRLIAEGPSLWENDKRFDAFSAWLAKTIRELLELRGARLDRAEGA